MLRCSSSSSLRHRREAELELNRGGVKPRAARWRWQRCLRRCARPRGRPRRSPRGSTTAPKAQRACICAGRRRNMARRPRPGDASGRRARSTLCQRSRLHDSPAIVAWGARLRVPEPCAGLRGGRPTEVALLLELWCRPYAPPPLGRLRRRHASPACGHCGCVCVCCWACRPRERARKHRPHSALLAV